MKYFRGFSSSQTIIIGFASVILLGSLLLMLPVSAEGAGPAPFSDALFTAVSAVCVTGLVVRDTATGWSLFGQAVILMLIEIGGMGVITVSVAVIRFSGRKISIRQKSLMQESVSAHEIGGILNLTGMILKGTAAAELLGAVLMIPVFAGQFGFFRGVWYGVFHSVSAFCNAGFDLMGIREPFSSLTSFSGHPLINLVIMTLIIVGGIGFLTGEDVRRHRFRIRKYRMQSRLILATAGFLIAVPAIYFFFFEFQGEPFGRRIFMSLFQSVTTRTAGFNTADLTKLSDDGQLVMILLMLVGGAPGSTAGGMKTTTFAVMLATALSVMRKGEETSILRRRIDDETVRNAAALFTVYIFSFLIGGMIISNAENLPLLTCLFETASAIGTVGLSLGITGQLGMLSRTILILLMFWGRVGGLTLIYAALAVKEPPLYRLPKEKLMVG